MIESSMMVNDRMPEYCVARMMHILNKAKKSINGANILILGVAYKNDIDDYRESPAIRVIEELKKVGAEVKYYDAFVPEFIHNGLSMKSEPELTEKLLQCADIVAITANHSNIDYDFVQQNATFVFDTKNAMKNVRKRDNVEVL